MPNNKRYAFLFSIMFCLVSQLGINAQSSNYLVNNPDGSIGLSIDGADFFSQLAINCLHKEYPNKLNQSLNDSSQLKSPKELHPAFYGCYDWHSSVHGHWMLVHLIRHYPGLNSERIIVEKLNETLTEENILAELAYINAESKSWERMYGWSWLLKLADELHTWKDPRADRWYANLKPLIDEIIRRYQEFLLVQTYPVRTGVHPNTAFGLSFAFDYAVTSKKEELEWLIRKTALKYYLDDQNCPASWEPSGEDFLSPCLEEANLMRRVLDPRSFNNWFEDFMEKKELKSLMTPADVSDRSDPKIVHLDGLNLSRASCFYGIARISNNDKLKEQLQEAAQRHLSLTLPYVATDQYEGSHWLGTFAVYALSAK